MKGRAYPGSVTKDRIDVARMLALYANEYLLSRGQEKLCGSGDSGAGVFAQNKEKDALDFVGLLVATADSPRSRGAGDNPVGLFIPADVVFKHLRDATGKDWDVYVV